MLTRFVKDHLAEVQRFFAGDWPRTRETVNRWLDRVSRTVRLVGAALELVAELAGGLVRLALPVVGFLLLPYLLLGPDKPPYPTTVLRWWREAILELREAAVEPCRRTVDPLELLIEAEWRRFCGRTSRTNGRSENSPDRE